MPASTIGREAASVPPSFSASFSARAMFSAPPMPCPTQTSTS